MCFPESEEKKKKQFPESEEKKKKKFPGVPGYVRTAGTDGRTTYGGFLRWSALGSAPIAAAAVERSDGYAPRRALYGRP